MTTLLAFGAGLILIGGLIWFIVRMARKGGIREAVNDAQSEVLDSVAEADRIRNRLRDDPEFAARMSDKFTRQ